MVNSILDMLLISFHGGWLCLLMYFRVFYSLSISNPHMGCILSKDMSCHRPSYQNWLLSYQAYDTTVTLGIADNGAGCFRIRPMIPLSPLITVVSVPISLHMPLYLPGERRTEKFPLLNAS